MHNKKGTLISAFAPVLFGGALLVLIPLRCYQFVKILQPGTGFYERTDWSVWVSYILLAVCVAAGMAFARLHAKIFAYNCEPLKSTASALAAFLLALTLVISATVQFREGFALISDDSAYENAMEMYFRSGAFARMAEGVCAAVSAVFFAIFGWGHITAKNNASGNRLLALFPVLWCVFRLMHRFMRTINFLNVSDLLYELFMCVALMLFFMAFAQLNSKVGSQNIAWKLLGYGGPACLLCLLCFLPRFIMAVTGHVELLCADSPIEWCDLGCTVFIITLLISRVQTVRSAAQANPLQSETDGDEES